MPQITAAESLPSETSVLSEADPVPKAQQVAQDETWSDEKDDVGSATEEKEEPTSDTQTRPTHVDREAFPATFDDLCRQMTERANFLLEVIHLLDRSLLSALTMPMWISPTYQIIRAFTTLLHFKSPRLGFVYCRSCCALFPTVGTLNRSVS